LLVFWFFCFLAALGIEFQASYLLAKPSNTSAMPLVLLLLVCLSERVGCFCPGQPRTMILLPLFPE
jgi:hypothetical protein